MTQRARYATIDTIRFETSVLTNPAIHAVWNEWEWLDLPDCWLAAGCLAQTVWNARFGFIADYGISDIDLIYCDPNDLSQQGEEEQAKRIFRCREHFATSAAPDRRHHPSQDWPTVRFSVKRL